MNRDKVKKNAVEKIKEAIEAKKNTPFSIGNDASMQKSQLGVETKYSALHEAFGSTAFPVIGNIDTDDWQYRKLQTNKKDLPAYAHERQLRIAFYMYLSNPLAYRILETTKDFIVGDGIEWEAPDPKIDKIIHKFWNNPVNNFNAKQYIKVLELCLYGELIQPTFVSTDGSIELGYVDPINVVDVITDDDNVEKMLKVRYRVGKNMQTKSIINVLPGSHKKYPGLLDGECFYFALNKVSNMTRGHSDLLAMIDWLDNYDQFLFNQMDRANFLNQFIWDVKLEGQTDEQIKKWINQQRQPKAGSIRAHNEGVEWNAVAPDLKASDIRGHADLALIQILGGAGLPPHWFSVGSGTNKACYSSDTETLTEHGWKHYWEIGYDTKIASFDDKTKTIKFEPAKDLYCYPYDGEMVHFSNQNMDILVTPDHRMLGKTTGDYRVVKAEEIQKNRWSFLNSARYEGEDIKEFVFDEMRNENGVVYPKIKVDGDAFIEFLGYFLSEGSAGKGKKNGGYTINIGQKKNEIKQKIDKCFSLLPELKFHSCDNNKNGMRQWYKGDKRLCLWLIEKCGQGSYNKKFPTFLHNISERQARILFNALMDGDGTYYKNGNGSGCYYSMSEQLINDFQRLAMRLGYRAKVRDDRKPNTSYTLAVTVNPNCNESSLKPQEHIKKIDYQGNVYCFKTSTGFFVTRRNGKIAIQGNTASEMGVPVIKRLVTKQAQIRQMFEYMFNYAIDQAIIHGTLDKKYGTYWEYKDKTEKDFDKYNRNFIVKMPQIFDRDIVSWMQSMSAIVFALQTGMQNGWMTNDESLKIFKHLISQIGVEFAKTGAVKITPPNLNPQQVQQIIQPVGGHMKNVPQAPSPFPNKQNKDVQPIEEAMKLIKLIESAKYSGVLADGVAKKLSQQILLKFGLSDE